MLSVLSFAKANAKSDRADGSRVVVEKLQIDNLIKAQEEATSRYDELVASFTQLETQVTSLTSPPVGAISLDTTNAFVTIPPTQVLLLGGRTPVEVHGSVTQPEHAIRSQLSICVSAVSQLAQAFDTAAHSWKVGTNLEFAAMSNAFDDVKYHFVHLHRINKTIQSHGQYQSDPGSAHNGFPLSTLPNSIIRAPCRPKDERTALVSQAYMKVQQPQYMKEQQRPGLHNAIYQQHHALQQQQLSQPYSETTPASSVGRDYHTPSPHRQGTSPQEQDPQNSSVEVEQAQPVLPQAEQPFGSIDDDSSSMSMVSAVLQGGDVLDNFDFDSFLHVGDSDPRLHVVANSTTGGDGEVGSGSKTSNPPLQALHTSPGPLSPRELARQQQIRRQQMQQRQLQQQQDLQQQEVQQQALQQRQTDESSKKRSWSEANPESYCKVEPSTSEGGDLETRSEEVDALPSVADMHTTDDLEVEKASSAVDALDTNTA
ncbi:hypothetical protein LTR56_022917 [Elasticomyces elasticus]|nr:hypothetical protein LTR56_022917 [Elasticomyces elasticus]KAK5747864.1 hypothetical protein LTS12_022062 [Elasticomyces elasticus]